MRWHIRWISLPMIPRKLYGHGLQWENSRGLLLLLARGEIHNQFFYFSNLA